MFSASSCCCWKLLKLLLCASHGLSLLKKDIMPLATHLMAPQAQQSACSNLYSHTHPSPPTHNNKYELYAQQKDRHAHQALKPSFWEKIVVGLSQRNNKVKNWRKIKLHTNLNRRSFPVCYKCRIYSSRARERYRSVFLFLFLFDFSSPLVPGQTFSLLATAKPLSTGGPMWYASGPKLDYANTHPGTKGWRVNFTGHVPVLFMVTSFLEIRRQTEKQT